MHSRRERERWRRVLVFFFFFFFVMVKQRREFCIEILYSRYYCRRDDDVYVCIYIFSFFFFHFNCCFDGVYRYAILFLSFDSIDALSLSFSFLFILLQSNLLAYSVSMYAICIFFDEEVSKRNSSLNEHR